MHPLNHLRRAFSLVEILVVLAIIAILAALVLPAIAGAKAKAQATQCTNFLRQLGGSALLYAADHEMTLPMTVHQRRQGGKSWTLTLQEYAGGRITFRCPCDENATRTYTYVLNDFLTPNPAGASDLDLSRISRIEHPAETIMYAEAAKGYTGSDHLHFAEHRGEKIPADVFAEQVAVERHSGSANFVFVDGHLELLPWEKTQERLAASGSRFVDPTREGTASAN